MEEQEEASSSSGSTILDMTGFALNFDGRDCDIVKEAKDKTYKILPTLQSLSAADLEELEELATKNSKYVMADHVIRKYAEVLPEFKEVKDTSDK